MNPCRLELNAAGSWKLIARFDAFHADDRADVLNCAARLVDALASAGSPGLKLRVSTDESQPRTPHVLRPRARLIPEEAGGGAVLTAAPITYRRFRVECECDGAPFVWEGPAVNEKAAIRCAAHDLAVKVPMVEADHVRATSCVEVPA